MPLLFHGFSDTVPTLQELQTLQHNTKQINVIESIAANWEWVAVALSIKPERIDIIRSDSPHDVEKACRRMLQWWLDSEKDKATWHRLISAIDSKDRLHVFADNLQKALQ